MTPKLFFTKFKTVGKNEEKRARNVYKATHSPNGLIVLSLYEKSTKPKHTQGATITTNKSASITPITALFERAIDLL